MIHPLSFCPIAPFFDQVTGQLWIIKNKNRPAIHRTVELNPCYLFYPACSNFINAPVALNVASYLTAPLIK